MIRIIKPHPNYLKVLNTYTWLLTLVFCCCVVFIIDAVLIQLSMISFLVILTLFITHSLMLQFLEKEYKVELTRPLKIKTQTSLLLRAYGLIDLELNDVKIKGVAFSDYKSLEKELEGK
jgi:energy-coupling factor transporter transmembrane protein EcfT